MRLDKPYQQKRSYNLQKFKDFNDTEATIVGYEIGKGKREGTLGKFLMQDDDGIEFGCPPGKGYNYKDLADILKNIHDYIGKRATFTYLNVLSTVVTDTHYLKLFVTMSKLVWQLYNDNMISIEVANMLLDQHYNRVNKT